MPKVLTSKKRPPVGWETIEPTIMEMEQRMRDSEWPTKAETRGFGAVVVFNLGRRCLPSREA